MATSVSGFIRNLTRYRWINFTEKEGNMRGGGESWVSLEKEGLIEGRQAYPLSSKALTIMDYLIGKDKKCIHY